jgi:hypothetical protein
MTRKSVSELIEELVALVKVGAEALAKSHPNIGIRLSQLSETAFTIERKQPTPVRVDFHRLIKDRRFQVDENLTEPNYANRRRIYRALELPCSHYKPRSRTQGLQI